MLQVEHRYLTNIGLSTKNFEVIKKLSKEIFPEVLSIRRDPFSNENLIVKTVITNHDLGDVQCMHWLIYMIYNLIPRMHSEREASLKTINEMIKQSFDHIHPVFYLESKHQVNKSLKQN